MNQPTMFEDRLLAALEAEVSESAARATRHHRRRKARMGVLVGAAAAVVAAAVAAPVMLGNQTNSAAWAVETRPDGSVKVEVREFKDPEGLERRLAEAGIPAYISFVPPGMACVNKTIRSDFSPRQKGVEPTSRGWIIRPGHLAPDERLALSAYADDPGDIVATHINVVPMSEGRCEIKPMMQTTTEGTSRPTHTR